VIELEFHRFINSMNDCADRSSRRSRVS